MHIGGVMWSCSSEKTKRLPAYWRRPRRKAMAAVCGVTEILEDESPFKLDYDPDHPDANEEGYVEMPNVDLVVEMVDMMSATRSYEANITATNAIKSMALKALEI